MADQNEKQSKQAEYEASLKKEVYVQTIAEVDKPYYHVKLERKHFNKDTGEKLSVPCVQMFNSGEFKQMNGMKERLAYTTFEVLWNPNIDWPIMEAEKKVADLKTLLTEKQEMSKAIAKQIETDGKSLSKLTTDEDKASLQTKIGTQTAELKALDEEITKLTEALKEAEKYLESLPTEE